MRPRVAVYKFSSCAGCQLQILNIEEHLLEIVGAVDLAYFVMARRETGSGPYDIGFVEGAVTSPEEVARIKEARAQCKTLVAMGACAAYGGVPAIKNFHRQADLEARVYQQPAVLRSVRAAGIDEYVKVEAYLQGCPIEKGEFLELVKSALLGTKPAFRAHAVCFECKLRENVCLFQSAAAPCLGSVTAAGCGALCPGVGRPCLGCRGPCEQANAPALARELLAIGQTPADVRRRFRMFAAGHPALEAGVAVL